jgi:hypothetical protein
MMSRELAVGVRDLALCERGRVLARETFGPEAGSMQAALQRLLPQRPAAPIIASVAASHTRMLLLPWLPQLTGPERWLSLAASRFEQTFGEAPDGWELRVAEDLPPQARLAAAIPSALLRSLLAVARLRAVRIGLLDALGSLLEREAAFSGCVAQVGPDSACLLMLWRGQLRRVRMRRFDALEALAAAARSEWIAVRGLEPDGVVETAVAFVGDNRGAAVQLSGAIGCTRIVELS